MKEPKLERIIIEDDIVCDYCNREVYAGSLVFMKSEYDETGEFYPLYLCSQNCLDNYEAEEFTDELENGLHDTVEDYFDFDDEIEE